MSSFDAVVKSLKENKDTTDAGFTRLETAITGTDSKSQLEEKAKQEANEKKKEQSYFANIGDELELVNKNLIDGFKGLTTPSGALGGLMGLIAAPIFFIKGFLGGLADAFKALGIDFKKLKIVDMVTKFVKTTLPNFFRNIFGPKGAIGKQIAIFKGSVVGKPLVDFFARIKTFFQSFKGGKLVTAIEKGFKFMIQPFKMVGDLIKMFSSGGKIGGAIANFTKTFSGITKFASTVGRILGRLFLPITFLITAFDTIKGAIDGFFGTEGNLFQKFLGGIGGALKGFMKIVTVPVDLVKSLISWIAGKFGFTEFEKLLDSFSFTELFGKAVDWLFVDVPAWFRENLSFAKAKEVLGKGMDIIGEFGKTISRLISRAWGFIKNLFGFGDKSDFGQSEMPVTKDLKSFFSFQWLKDFFKPVTDLLDKIMNFDFLGFVKKLPGGETVMKLLNPDKKLKAAQESGLYDKDIIGDSEIDRSKVAEAAKTSSGLSQLQAILDDDDLSKEDAEFVRNAMASAGVDSAKDKSLKTANLAGVKPTDGSDFKDVDPSEMTREQLNAALIDYSRERNKLRGARKVQFDRANQKLRQALLRRRLEFKKEDKLNMPVAERAEADRIKQANLAKIGMGSQQPITVVNNTNNSPVNNNTKTTTLSPLVQVDPVMKAAIGADF